MHRLVVVAVTQMEERLVERVSTVVIYTGRAAPTSQPSSCKHQVPVPDKDLDCAQNYWVPGLCHSSGIQNTINTMFLKLDLFPSSNEGPLERANLNHWKE
jgi:hypothetical protein